MDVESLIGRVGQVGVTIVAGDTAIAVGSGEVPVLGTPRLIALMERATCSVLHPELGSEHTSVGVRVDISHRRPTPIGATVTVTAKISAVDGSRVTFDVSADHELASGERVERIGRGTIIRAVVERSAFGVETDEK